VNAANKALIGGSEVDGAIHNAAGPKLRKACRKLGGCEVGESVITPAFRLPSKYIIATVGPRGNTINKEEKLKSCYVSALEVANNNTVASIAFPCISSMRFPIF
jgi:O-acetyl-ADP-ribose deacetylase (regulator of RNase III)